MSARFGRNQRRKLRDEIATKEQSITALIERVMESDAKIAALRTGDWERATPADTALTSLVGHITAYEITEGVDRRGSPTKKASLDVWMEYPQMDKLESMRWDRSRNSYSSKPRRAYVEWRGGVWEITDLHVSRRDKGYGEHPDVSIDLRALPVTRRHPEQYLFGSDVQTQIKFDTVTGPAFFNADTRPEHRFIP